MFSDATLTNIVATKSCYLLNIFYVKGTMDGMILQAVKFVIDQLQCYVQLYMKVNINSCPL